MRKRGEIVVHICDCDVHWHADDRNAIRVPDNEMVGRGSFPVQSLPRAEHAVAVDREVVASVSSNDAVLMVRDLRGTEREAPDDGNPRSGNGREEVQVILEGGIFGHSGRVRVVFKCWGENPFGGYRYVDGGRELLFARISGAYLQLVPGGTATREVRFRSQHARRLVQRKWVSSTHESVVCKTVVLGEELV